MYFGLRLSSSLRLYAVFIGLLLVTSMLQAQLTQAVGSPSAIQTATITITATGTSDAANPIYVLTQGAQNSDFKLVSGGSCAANTNYATLGAACTVNYTFTPSQPGIRYGGITLMTSTGALLGNAYITGTGTGPEVVFTPPAQGGIAGSINSTYGVAVNGNGDVYIGTPGGDGTGVLYEVPHNCTDATCVRTIGTHFASTAGLGVDGSGNVFLVAQNFNGMGCTLYEYVAVGGAIPANAVPSTFELDGVYPPAQIAIDGSGNIYMTDDIYVAEVKTVNGVIPAGVASTRVSPTLYGAEIDGVAVDAAGDVYFSAQDQVGRISAVDGSVSMIAVPSGFNEGGLAVDESGDLYASDTYGNGVVFEFLAVNGVVPANPVTLSFASTPKPGALAIGPHHKIYVASYATAGIATLDFTTPTILNFPTSTHDGSVDPDSPLSFQITNGGNETLSAVSPGLGGLTTGNFSQVAGSGTPADCTNSFVLVAGVSCNVSIQFAPVAPAGQAVTDTFTFIDNDLNATPSATQAANLNGTAIPPLPLMTGISPAGGPSAGGTPVTITGTYLTTASAVNFGSVTATDLTVVSDTEITVLSPTGTGGSTVGVTVTTYGGTSAPSPTDQFTYALTPDVITVPGSVPSTVLFGSGTVSIGATSTSGVPVIYTSTTSTVCTVTTGGVITFASIGACTVNVSQDAAGAYAAATTVPVTIQVTPGTNTITLTGTVPSSIAFNSGTASVAATSTSGAAVTYTSTTTSICSVDTLGTVTFSSIGACTVTLSQAAAGNFAAAPTLTEHIQVTPGANTIAFPALSDTIYGGAAPVPAATSTAGQTAIAIVYNSSTTSVCTSTAGGVITLVGAGGCTITANQSAAGNFAAAAPVSQSFTVQPAANAITVPNTVPASVAFGTGTVSIGATSTSGQPVAYTSTTTGVCTVTTPGGVVTPVSIGLCTVDVSQDAAGNYAAAATVVVNITITVAANSIAFPALPNTAYNVTAPVPAAAAASGQPVTYSSSTTAACTTTTDGAITLVATGLCTITASQNAVGNYAAAATVSQSFIITAGTLPVGTSSVTLTVPVTITMGGTLNAINVLTQGATGLDFNVFTPAVAPSGACATGMPYNVGDVCTVQYTFKPTQPFIRAGGVSLSDASGDLLGNSFLAGTGTGSHAVYSTAVPLTLGSGFSNTAAIAVDASGDVFVADSTLNTVSELVAVNGVVPSNPAIRTLGSGYLNPGGVAVDGSGNVYVADTTNGAVKELVAVNGVVPADPAIAMVLTLDANINATGIAVDADGNVFLSDTNGNAIREIQPGCLSASCAITLGNAQSPQGIAVDNAGNVYFSDFTSAHVRKFTAVNGSVPPGSTSVPLASGINFVYGLAVDGLGNVYIGDTNNNSIKEILAADDSVITLATNLYLPQGIAVDVSGNVYEADSNGSAIHELSYTTAPSLNFATPTVNGTADTDSPQSFQIVNNGNAALTAIAPGIGGLATGSFIVVAGSGTPADCSTTFSLASGASCNVSVAFKPAPGSNDAVTDTISLIDNSLNATPSAAQTVGLSGTAIAPLPVVVSISPSSGSVLGGTLITITGSGFTGLTNVGFGTQPAASFTVVSDTTVTAVYPGGTSGAVDVVVTTIAGASLTSPADLFTSTIPPSFGAGSEPVGMQSSRQTAFITITTAGTLNTISILTQGATMQDFKVSTGGAVRLDACTATTAYTVGQVCSVNYIFTPTHPWLRVGGVSLADASGNILGSTYLSGTGTGPQATYTSSTMVPVALGGNNFGLVQGMAVDGSGNVYVADTNNKVVEEIPAGCVLSTCVVTLASGYYAEGVAVDGLGNLYIADITDQAVKEMVAVGGVVSSSAKVLTRYSGVAPYGITVDATGNVFFTDVSYGSVDELPVGGSFTRLANGFAQPYGVAVDQSGNIYVGGNGNGVISKVPPGGGAPVVVHTFTNITSLAIDGAGNVYAANLNVPGVSELIAVNGSLPAAPATLQLAGTVQGPYALAVDQNGNVYTTTYTAPVAELAYGSAPAVNFATPTPQGSTDTTDGAQSFQIVNSGNEPLTGTAPATGSLTTGDFAQVAGSGTPADCASTFSLSADARCNVSFSFVPSSSASGAITDSFIVDSNSLNANPDVSQTVTINGTAAANTPAITLLSVTSGVQTGGTGVGILGSLFTNATAVTFGGVPAAGFVIYSDNVIFAVSPPGMGTVDIQVTTPLGTSAITPADRFTYVVPSIYNAGSEAVGTQSQVLTAAVNISTAGTLQTISVLTQGTPGLDFKLYTPTVAPSGACVAGTAYIVGQSCTVQYTFTPTHPWVRPGGISLADANGVLLGNSILSGTGTAPQVVYNKTIQVQLGGGFQSPNSIALDGAGDVYVADTANNAVKEIPVGCTTASCTLTLGSGFNAPKGIAVDGSGNIFVTDKGAGLYSSVEELIAVAGTIPSNPVIVSLGSVFITPTSLALDQAGDLFVADAGEGAVEELIPSGGIITPNTTPNLLGTFSSPQGVAVDSSGNVYVADAGTANAVYELVATGGVVQYGATSVTLHSGFSSASGVAVDGSGNVYATDAGAPSALYKIVAVGGAIPATPVVLTLSAGFSAPGGVAVDASGNVLVASTGSNTVQRLRYALAPSIQFPATTLAGTNDATDGALSLQITNNGNAALTAVDPGLGGLTSGDFAQVAGSGTPADCTSTFSVPAGGSCNVSIAFAPTSAASGAVSDTFTLIDNDLNAAHSATQSIFLAGSVTPLPPTVTSLSPVTGSTLGGTVVTITGTHLTGATAVHFGSAAAASVTVISDTSISAPAPASNAGAVDITVTTSGGTSAISEANQFIYTTFASSPGIWIVKADGRLTRLDEGGNIIASNIGAANGTSAAAGGVAFDSSGQIWSVNSSVNQLFTADKTGAATSTYTGGGLSAPAAIAIDGDGDAWIANGNGSVSEFKSGAAVTPITGYTGGGMSSPTGISIDIAGNVWVSNAGANSSVTEILGGAAPSSPLAVGTQTNTLGVRP